MIRRLINRLRGSTFARAAAILASGQVLAAAIPMLAAPILGRLYLPSDYGALGAYMATANVLGILGTLQFHHAIMLPKTDEEAHRIVSLVLAVAAAGSAFAFLVAIGIFFFASQSAEFAVAKWWGLLLPFTVFAVGQNAASTMLANRASKFSALAWLPVINVVVIVSVSLSLGLLGLGVHGLFAGYFAGQTVTFAICARLLKTLAPSLKSPSLGALSASAKSYRRFPLYTAPSEMMGTFNMQAPIFALGTLHLVSAIGAFTRARQLVGLPLQLIGTSVGQVFRQRAAQLRLNGGNCRALYLRTGLTLLALGSPPMLIMVLFAPDIFRFVLGPSWTQAGELTRIIAPALLLQFVCSPLSTVFYIMERQRLELGLAFAAFGLQIFAMGWGAWMGGTPEAILFGYSVAFCLTYAAYLIIGWQISVSPPSQPTLAKVPSP